jgi:hypothetical protein
VEGTIVAKGHRGTGREAPHEAPSAGPGAAGKGPRRPTGSKTGSKGGRKVPAPRGGYVPTSAGVLVPARYAEKPVPSNKLVRGLTAARSQIEKAIGELASIMTEDYRIDEIEFSVSFDADGRFLGFGVGGAASITVKIKPTRAKD